MEPESTRIDSLERRVAGLERRMRTLEDGRAGAVAGDAERAADRSPGQAPAIEPPPRPATAFAVRTAHPTPPAPPLPAPHPAGAHGAASGWTGAAPAVPSARAPRAARADASRAAARWQTPVATPLASTAERPAVSLRDLEERFAGRALAWVGGVALVAAAVFFLSLAFSRGWITEPMRVVVGLVAGALALGAGAVLLARKNGLLGNVLAGVGLGIIAVDLLAATRLYRLVTPELGLLGALVAAGAAAAIAIRFDARSVAIYGLVAALLAPPLVGAPPTPVTLLFVGVTLVGTTAIALFRSWRWLPQVAFVLAAPQLAGWLVGPADAGQALIALSGFWLVNVVAAAGEEVRIRRDDLRPSSATLVLANGAFLVWGLVEVLDGPLAGLRGTAVAAASLAHLVVGGWFLARQGLEHLFGNLVAGTGVALLALATFLQLGAPIVPMAWAAEAVALAWLAARRLHRWSAVTALALAALAIGHLVLVEYPIVHAGLPADVVAVTPLLHPAGAALCGVLLALAVTGMLVPVRWVRSALLAAGTVLVAYAAPFEVSGTVLAGALVVTALAAIAIDRLLALGGSAPRLVAVLPAVHATRVATAVAAVPGALAVALLFATELRPRDLGELAASPFLNPAFASLAIVLAGLAVAGALLPVRAVRSAAGGLGVLLLTWGLAFQVEGVALVGGLAILLPVSVLLERGLDRVPDAPVSAAVGWSPLADRLAAAAGAMSWADGALVAIATLGPLRSWGRITPPPVPFSDSPALAAGLLVASALAVVPLLDSLSSRRAALVAAILAAAWVVPFEVYADGVVVLWILLAAVAIPVSGRDPRGVRVHTGVASLLWAGGLLVAFAIVARPDRLVLEDPSRGVVPLLAGWPLAFLALAAGAWVGPRLAPLARWRRGLEGAAGVIALYAVSIGVVDLFRGRLGGSVGPEELSKQAQVALSVCWTAIGAAALSISFARHRPRLRHAGLALLGLATAKVFLVDLAAMDVAYRAIVLAGLGLLLLASAWVVTRSRGPRAGRSGLAGGGGAAA